MLDSYTSSMCVESWGRGSFARALIELDATRGLKEMLVGDISKLEGSLYTHVIIALNNLRLARLSRRQKTSKCGNCELQGKRQGIGFNKPSNGSYRPVVKPQSNTSVSDIFSSLEKDNVNSIDDLVDDTLKNRFLS
ncbi:hypothetical protein Tco_0696640 [Tanacetum coccineum]